MTANIKELADALSNQQRAFADLVISGENQTRAYMSAYGQENPVVAASDGSKLVSNPKVAAYIDAHKQSSLERVGMTLEVLDKMLFDRLQAVVGTRQDDVLEWGVTEVDGVPRSYVSFRSPDSLTDSQKLAVKSVQTGQTNKIELHDAGELLKLAYQRHGALTQKNENKTTGSITLTIDQADVEV